MKTAVVIKNSVHYNVKQTSSLGQMTSMVPGWEVTYPALYNGRLSDTGYVASMNRGGAYYVIFNENGEPYCPGRELTKMTRERLMALRKDFPYAIKH
jgi:hypothetical protein